jgi:hypothetical protein
MRDLSGGTTYAQSSRMRQHRWFVAGLGLALLAVPSTGCLEEKPECHSLDDVDPGAERRAYVIDRIGLHEVQLDLDHDQAEENALWSTLEWLYSSAPVDVDAGMARLIAGGELLQLVDLQADSDCAALRLMRAVDLDGNPADNFGGAEVFAVDGSAGASVGRIEARHLSTVGGTLPIELALPGLHEEPFLLGLTASRVEAEVSEGALAGVIAGGIRDDEVRDVLVPVLHRAVVRLRDALCPTGICPMGSQIELLSALLDRDMDGAISAEEFASSPYVPVGLDVDLRDAGGAYRPGRDGVVDSLSFAFDFHAVPAELQP